MNHLRLLLESTAVGEAAIAAEDGDFLRNGECRIDGARCAGHTPTYPLALAARPQAEELLKDEAKYIVGCAGLFCAVKAEYRDGGEAL